RGPEPRAPPVRRGQAAGDARLRAPVPLGAAGEERAQRLQRRARRGRRPQQLPSSAQAVRGRPWAAAAAAAEAQGRADERLKEIRRCAVPGTATRAASLTGQRGPVRRAPGGPSLFSVAEVEV